MWYTVCHIKDVHLSLVGCLRTRKKVEMKKKIKRMPKQSHKGNHV